MALLQNHHKPTERALHVTFIAQCSSLNRGLGFKLPHFWQHANAKLT